MTTKTAKNNPNSIKPKQPQPSSTSPKKQFQALKTLQIDTQPLRLYYNQYFLWKSKSEQQAEQIVDYYDNYLEEQQRKNVIVILQMIIKYLTNPEVPFKYDKTSMQRFVGGYKQFKRLLQEQRGSKQEWKFIKIMDRIFDNPIVAVFVPVVIYIIMFTIDERVLQVWLENVWMFPMFFVSIGLGVVLIVRRRREQAQKNKKKNIGNSKKKKEKRANQLHDD